MKQKIIRYLQGSMEMALFMRSGIDFFPNDRREALWSFIVPLLCIPPTLFYAVAAKPDSLATLSPAQICVALTLKATLSVAVFLYAIWFFSGWVGKRENYWRFVTTGNWVSVIMLIILAPFLIFDANNWAAQETIRAMLIILSLYGYAVTGYIATRALNIPWMLGGAVGIFELFISETFYDIIKAYYGV